MPEFLEIILRTFTAFIILWVFVHMLGRQTISQKTYHLYIATITMGTIAGNLAFNLNVKFRYFLLSFFLMGTVLFVLNTLTVKYHRYREWIEGKPTTLIHEGIVLDESLKKMGYSLDMVKQALRKKEIFNIEEVESAILEVNGSLSVLKKTEYQNVTRKDLNIGPQANKVPVEVVMDGKILYQNLSNHFYNEEWLLTELRHRNILVSQIAYAVVGTKGNLYIDIFKD